MGGGEEEGPQHLPPACQTKGLLNRVPSPDLRLHPASSLGLFSCLCCIALPNSFLTPLLRPPSPAAVRLRSVIWSKLLFLIHLHHAFFFHLFFHLLFLLKRGINWRRGWPFPLRLSGALFFSSNLFYFILFFKSFPYPCITTWLCMPALSFHPSNPRPSAVLSGGGGASLCAKVPPVYRAPQPSTA